MAQGTSELTGTLRESSGVVTGLCRGDFGGLACTQKRTLFAHINSKPFSGMTVETMTIHKSGNPVCRQQDVEDEDVVTLSNILISITPNLTPSTREEDSGCTIQVPMTYSRSLGFHLIG